MVSHEHTSTLFKLPDTRTLLLVSGGIYIQATGTLRLRLGKDEGCAELFVEKKATVSNYQRAMQK
jgi:hypothetical protein